MPILKSSYKIDPEHLDVIDQDFAMQEVMAGNSEFGTFVDWGRMLRQLGYTCVMCDGSGILRAWDNPERTLPCAVCANLCPTCGKPWKGRDVYDKETHPCEPEKED